MTCVLGVVGAGTMGAGIAQLGCQAGIETRLLDADPAALDRAREQIAAGIGKAAAKGRCDPGAAGHLALAASPGDLAGCTIVVEAIPEDLALKHRVLTEVAGAAGEACVLATNTSSLPVTQVAAGVPVPERVVGLHFFNPPPVMRLVEVIRGVATSDAAAQAATALGEAMGRHVIAAADGPGFLVNRVNRPFGLEALRCLQEGLADVATIDRIVRRGGGFRMGPFELQDLVGVDVGFAVSESLYRLSFGEPRWRPSPLMAQLAASGRHGRKTGRGWYAYPPGPPEDPPLPEPGGGDGLIVVAPGFGALGEDLLEAAQGAGWDVALPEKAAGEVPFLIVDCAPDDPDAPMTQGGPRVLLCAAASLAMLDGDGTAVGFHAVPGAELVELTRGPGTPDAAAAAAERFFGSLGRDVAWVGDAPGLVLGRLLAQLVNEAAFALGESVGSPEDVDAGATLGLNHPRGPVAWSDLIGVEHVVAILDALDGDAYRVAPLLRRASHTGSHLADLVR